MDIVQGFPEYLLRGLGILLHEESFCDVTIEVNGQRFRCHKMILSAMSPYFMTMFTAQFRESKDEVVPLPYLDAEEFKLLLDFLYLGKNILNKENACRVLEIAHFTQIDILQELCKAHLIQNMKTKNCVKILRLAKKLSFEDLEKEALNYLMEMFDQMIHEEDMFDLEIDEIQILLESSNIVLPREDGITEYLLRWLHRKLDRFETVKGQVYNLLRLPLSSGEYLLSVKKRHRYIFKDKEFKNLYEKALQYRLQPARSSDLCCKGTEQRNASMFENVMMVIGKSFNVYAYSFQRKQWFHLQSMPYLKKESSAACVFDSTIYISGGHGGNKTHSIMLRYDGMSNRWFELKMPFSIYRHAMVAVNECIFILGGETKSDTLLKEHMEKKIASNAVRSYDPRLRKWFVFGRLTHALCDVSVSVLKQRSKLCIIGGKYTSIECPDSVLLFDLYSKSCSELCRFHLPNMKLWSFSYGSDILIVSPNGRRFKLQTSSREIIEETRIGHLRKEVDCVSLYRNQLYIIGAVSQPDKEKRKFKTGSNLEHSSANTMSVYNIDTKSVSSSPLSFSDDCHHSLNLLVNKMHL